MGHPGPEDYGPYEEEDEQRCAAQVGYSTRYIISILATLALMFKILKGVNMSKIARIWLHVGVASITVSYFASMKLETIFIYNLFSVISLVCSMRKVNGYIVLSANIAMLIFIQNICRHIKNEDFFLSIRGILMMHIMRLTTVAFNFGESSAKEMNAECFTTYVEYIYFPPFVSFGPYMTIDQFIKMRNKKWTGFENELGLLMRAILAIFNGVTLVIISSCAFEYFNPTTQFGEDVVTAMSFRFSHYFICFITQASVLVLGSDVSISSPLNVELARSTLQVVSEWNKPFHTFLHENIFKRRFFDSTALNVLFTFTVSSLLHGRDSQMTFTLLALGFIAYSETVFRKRLATRYSMCVAAKPCTIRLNRYICKHKHTEYSKRVIAVNVFFMLLSVYHLIFTGMTFTDQYMSIGYPYSHAWYIWGTHYYSSFIISSVFLLLSKII